MLCCMNLMSEIFHKIEDVDRKIESLNKTVDAMYDMVFDLRRKAG